MSTEDDESGGLSTGLGRLEADVEARIARPHVGDGEVAAPASSAPAARGVDREAVAAEARVDALAVEDGRRLVDAVTVEVPSGLVAGARPTAEHDPRPGQHRHVPRSTRRRILA